LPRATALHNVELPLIYNGTPAEERIEKAKKALERVDLTSRMSHKAERALRRTTPAWLRSRERSSILRRLF